MLQEDRHFNDQLDLLLAQAEKTVPLARQRYDQYRSSVSDEVVLFGAGSLGIKVLRFLVSHGIQPVAFSDNRSELWNKTIEGIPVLSPINAVEEYGKSATFIVTIFNRSVRTNDVYDQLNQLGCKYVIPFAYFAWKYDQEFLPYYFIDLPDHCYNQQDRIRGAFQLLADEASREEFLAQMRWRLLGDFKISSQSAPDQQYFPKNIPLSLGQKVFVDCGAYNGDTLKSFLYHNDLHSAFLFEPDPYVYLELNKYIESLPDNLQSKIFRYQAAVGSETSQIQFSASGQGSSSVVSTGGITMACYALDDILPQRLPMYIKFDIEGFEKEALLGAKQLILSSTPDLAVCVYHKPDDLWNIPLMLHDLSKSYNLYLRRYMEDCWETVCYALR